MADDGQDTEVPPPPSGEPPPPGTGVEQAVGMSRRALIALLASLFLFGSCGVAVGLYRLSRGGDDASPTPPIPAPSGSASPSPDATPTASPTGEPLADLVVSELTAESVTATNVGTAAAGRFVVSVDGRAFIVEAGLGPGESAAFAFECAEGPLTATVDSTDRVEEADEANNARTEGPFDCSTESPSPSTSPDPSVSTTPSPTQTTPPPTGLPDLVVRQVSFNQVTVANIGNAAAGPFVVDVGPAGTFAVGGLSAGRSRTIKYPCTDGTLTAVADASGRVQESNERNNALTGGPFQCLPDLIVSALGPDTVTVANLGLGNAGPSIVTVRGVALSVPPLGPGERVTLSYSCVGQLVTAIADAQNQVAESNENNNERTEDVGPCP